MTTSRRALQAALAHVDMALKQKPAIGDVIEVAAGDALPLAVLSPFASFGGSATKAAGRP